MEEFPIGGAASFKGYSVTGRFKVVSGESDIYILDKNSEKFILKLYRYGISPARDVLKKTLEISAKHPEHIIRIYGCGYDEASERYFEIQEYAKFGTLRELAGSLTDSNRAAAVKLIIAQIIEGLKVLHDNRILHLDLKPSNILIRSKTPPCLILSDFGIASILESDVSSRMTGVKGTPLYSAPETFGGVVHKNSDYWSLGMMVMEIISGSHPLEGRDAKTIMYGLTTRGMDIPAGVPAEFRALLAGLLTREAHGRWGYDEVKRWLAGERDISIYVPKYARAYKFHNREYHSFDKLAAAFIENEECWEDAKLHLAEGYISKWLESCEDYDMGVGIKKIVKNCGADLDKALFKIIYANNKSLPFSLCGIKITLQRLFAASAAAMKNEASGAENIVLSLLLSGGLLAYYREYMNFNEMPENAFALFLASLEANFSKMPDKSEKTRFLIVSKLMHVLMDFMKYDIPANLRKDVSASVSYIIENIEKLIPSCGASENEAVENKAAEEKAGGSSAQPGEEASENDIDPVVYNKILYLRSRFEEIDDALLNAIAEGDSEVARILIDNGASVNAKDRDNDTALLKSVALGNAEIVKLLVDRGADVMAENNFGWTADMLAKDRKREDILKIVSAAGGAVCDKEAKTDCMELLSYLGQAAKRFAGNYHEDSVRELKNACSDVSEGMIERAALKIKKAMSFIPVADDVHRVEDACCHAGKMFFKMKRYDDAAFAYEKTLAINPINRDALDFFENRKPLSVEKDAVKDLIEKVSALETGGELETAFEKCLEITGKYPRSAAAHVKLASLYELKKNPVRALFEYERALDLEPDKYGSLFLKAARLSLEIKNHRSAVENLTRVRQLFPDDIDSRKALLEEYKFYYFDEDKTSGADEVIDSYRRFLSTRENDVMAHLEIAYIYNNLPKAAFEAGKINEKAISALENAARRPDPEISARPEIRAMMLNEIRLAFFNSEGASAAEIIDIYKKRHAMSPDDAYKCYEIGCLYNNLPMSSLAEKTPRELGLQFLIKSAELAADSVTVSLELARAYYRLEMFANALEQCSKILERHPENTAARLMKASILEIRDDPGGAFREFEAISAIDNRCSEAQARAVDIYYKIHESSPNRASKFFHFIQEAKRAVKNNFSDSMANFRLGYAYLKLSEFSPDDIGNSQMAFKQSMGADGDNVYAYLALAELYQKQSTLSKKDSFAEAENVCRAAISRCPHDPACHLALALAYDNNFKTNKKNEALGQYQKALYLSPFLVEARYRLALMFKSRKMSGEAVSEFKKVVEIDPNCPQAADSKHAILILEKKKA
ncbi:MAG TPA: protein kinase [Candidatus Wallbacteria bacterium]|mgnify:CR=1 FL=1|nr:protein kinase [Candidatus Wallbacteria bacterium]